MSSFVQMSYAKAFSFSWALTWRLIAGHLVLLLILFTLLIAFGSPHVNAHAAIFAFVSLILEWLVVWPFAIKRVLAPEAILDDAGLSGRFEVRSPVAMVLGFAADLLSLLPVVIAILLVRQTAWTLPYSLALILFAGLRLFGVLPLGIQALARRLPEIA